MHLRNVMNGMRWKVAFVCPTSSSAIIHYQQHPHLFKFHLPKALTLDRQRLEENNPKAALSPNTQMFVKAPHFPIKQPPHHHHHQICILIAFWLHFPPIRLLFIGALFLLRRHRYPRGAHLQQRTRTELRRKLLQLECNRICTPANLDSWTQRSHLPGDVRPLIYHAQKNTTNLHVLHNRSAESTRQNEHYRKTKTQVNASLAPSMPLMSHIPSSVFSLSLWIVFAANSLLSSSLHKSLEKWESFNDWIE